MDHGLLQIYDRVQGFDVNIHLSLLRTPDFLIGRWYAEQCAYNSELPNPWEVAQQWANERPRNTLLMKRPTTQEGVEEPLMGLVIESPVRSGF
jgi:hypothetical protein